jgi:L-lactate dehydrogenase complex protein LldF
MKPSTESFRRIAEEELKDAHTQRFLKIFPHTLTSRGEEAYRSFPDPAAAHIYGQVIRAEAIERLPALLEQFEARAKANGMRVFWARDGREANNYILELARQKGVRLVTKGKSMVTEETGLNRLLTENGVEVWETDLGEFIIQLLKRPPFHIVGPAINVPVEKVRDIFMEKGVLDEPTTDPVQLGRAARRFLREKFRRVDMGITGINMAVAETGTIINVENEGNIRFSKSSPRIQVSVMTIEKVVPTMMDAMHMLRVLCRSCTGQPLSAYATLDNGPRRPEEPDGPEELHVVILDNGRSEAFQDPVIRDVLRCIRCGACLNACPVYGKIGGYPYGWAYSGPMGQVVNPALLGLASTSDLYGACTLCQKCKTICPAGIDHPKILLYYRQKRVEGTGGFTSILSDLSGGLRYGTYAFAGAHPQIWRLFSRALRLAGRPYESDGRIRHMWAGFEGWFHARDLPAFPKETFHERWKRLKDEA